MGELRLASVIAGLREELTAAIDEGAGKGMQFAGEPIEVTLQVVVTDEGHGKVGWKGHRGWGFARVGDHAGDAKALDAIRALVQATAHGPAAAGRHGRHHRGIATS